MNPISHTTTPKTVRIGGASGFWGDSSLGAPQLVTQGNIDYLVFDYLAELTMSLLAGARQKNPEAGYATDFVTVAMRSVLKDVAAKGIRVISNAGGVNPKGCAAALEALATEMGLSLRVAVVEGDDVMVRLADFRAQGVVEMATGECIPPRVASANAYLGAMPIAWALDQGAQIVITGRCVDSAVTLGALIHEFGWSAQDYDRLAGASLAGHVIECGCQGVGGLHTDWETVPDWANMGYPIVECAEDGSFVVTKPEGTGGLVTPATVGEQMLYEIGDPGSYLLPDVICDFRLVKMAQVGPTRVKVSGALGRPPTANYKVCATVMDGFRVTAQLCIVGIDAKRKAQRTALALLERGRMLLAHMGLQDFTATQVDVLGTESCYGPHSTVTAVREVVLRIAVTHPERKALEAFSREFAAPATSWSPGTTGSGGGRPSVSPVLRLFSFLIDKQQIAPMVTLGESSIRIPAPELSTTAHHAQRPLAPLEMVSEPTGPTCEVPLVRIAYGRSGDKGNTSNIGLIARSPALLPILREQVTEEKVAEYLRHLVAGPVRRYELPGINALNLVCEQALGGGGMASLRNDPLGKAMAQILLSMPVRVPIALLQD